MSYTKLYDSQEEAEEKASELRTLNVAIDALATINTVALRFLLDRGTLKQALAILRDGNPKMFKEVAMIVNDLATAK